MRAGTENDIIAAGLIKSVRCSPGVAGIEIRIGDFGVRVRIGEIIRDQGDVRRGTRGWLVIGRASVPRTRISGSAAAKSKEGHTISTARRGNGDLHLHGEIL